MFVLHIDNTGYLCYYGYEQKFGFGPVTEKDTYKRYIYRMKERIYIAIDLKSFYASAECMERGLDPLNVHLVVADDSRTDKTICLAVTPSLKAYGIPGRPRLFEVIRRVKEINESRAQRAGKPLSGSSCEASVLEKEPSLALDFIVAKPRMALYMQKSAQIFRIYLRYVAPEDIHVYSVDEVFMDVTDYLSLYRTTPEGLARRMIGDVLSETGITATAGIGTNLYLCKVAMDIRAKRAEPDKNGVRVAFLDELTYRETLWAHEPITDFWRVGSGYAKRLRRMGLYTMGDVAMCSLQNGERLYREFGVAAELLIDHAWGFEPCGIRDIRAYVPASNSISSGQVLPKPYDFRKGRLIVREMTDLLALDLARKGTETDQIVLTVGYDAENLKDPLRAASYRGPVALDRYGRRIPEHSLGTVNLGMHTSSPSKILDAVTGLYDRIADPSLLIRRFNLSANHILPEGSSGKAPENGQTDFFTDPAEADRESEARRKEKAIQDAILGIRRKYGKNAVLKGMNLEEGATARERNRQIGGHRA